MLWCGATRRRFSVLKWCDSVRRQFLDYSQSDVWALGLVTYSMLSPVDPFGGVSAADRTDDPSAVPAPLSAIVKGMLTVELASRLSLSEALSSLNVLLAHMLFLDTAAILGPTTSLDIAGTDAGVRAALRHCVRTLT